MTIARNALALGYERLVPFIRRACDNAFQFALPDHFCAQLPRHRLKPVGIFAISLAPAEGFAVVGVALRILR
jgi:hypothetical protein